MKSNKNAYGLSIGTLSAGLHLLWVLAVWLGMAQPLADMWHAIHLRGGRTDILAASFGLAVMGVVSAFIIGYLIGWVFGLLFERFSK